MDGRAQRAAVPGSRIVVAEVYLLDVRRKSVGEEVKEHEDVGLLDDLRPLNPLAAQEHVDGDGPRLMGA
jgi:hypothetical protein